MIQRPGVEREAKQEEEEKLEFEEKKQVDEQKIFSERLLSELVRQLGVNNPTGHHEQIITDLLDDDFSDTQLQFVATKFATGLRNVRFSPTNFGNFSRYIAKNIPDKRLRGTLLGILNSFADSVERNEEFTGNLELNLGTRRVSILQARMRDVPVKVVKIGRGEKKLKKVKVQPQNLKILVEDLRKSEKFDIVKSKRGDIIHDPIESHNIGNIIILTSPKKFKEIIINANSTGEDILKLIHALISESGKLFDEDGNEIFSIVKGKESPKILRKILNLIASKGKGEQVRLLYVPSNPQGGHFVGGFMTDVKYKKKKKSDLLANKMGHSRGLELSDHNLYSSKLFHNPINI